MNDNELHALIKAINPRLNELRTPYVSPNYEKPEKPYGVPTFLVPTVYETYNPYPKWNSIEKTIDNFAKVNARPDNRYVYDVLEDRKLIPRTVDAERMSIKNRVRLPVEVANSGQIYQNEVVSDMFDNAAVREKKGTEEAQELMEHAAQLAKGGRRKKNIRGL